MVRQSHLPIVLLTRPLAQSERFARQVQGLAVRAQIVIAPLIEVVFRPVTLPEGDFSHLILTSENGARAAGRLKAEGQDLPGHAFCVGPQTAQTAGDLGFDTTVLGGDAAGLVQALASLRPSGPLLHLSGVHQTGSIAATLTVAGVMTKDCRVYDQVALPLSPKASALLAGAEPVILPLFSPRTVRLLGSHAPFSAPLTVIAISDAVAVAAASLGPLRLKTADRPDAEAVLRALGGILSPARP